MGASFIISLDFELHWGAAERWDIYFKKDYFNTTRESIPVVLKLFEKYGIHATWATVGFLFAKSKDQLLTMLPNNKPTYENIALSYYGLIPNEIGDNEKDDPYHYAPSLIYQIVNTPFQELGTHTFSHYYCNEVGQTKEQFYADLKAAQEISKLNFNVELKSLVFPRNQFNKAYLEVVQELGIKVVRSNPSVWFWKTGSKWNPLARAFDTLMPISDSLTFSLTDDCYEREVLLLPSSRFFRPYSAREKIIQSLKIHRIKSEMTYAAKKKKHYHLWWHPHNFGYSVKENLFFLEDILQHYVSLRDKYDFKSQSMVEMYNL